MNAGKIALRALLQTLAPVRCPGCDLGVGRAAFCEACAPLIERAAEGLWPRPGASACAAFDYGGPLADAIARVKYEERTEHATVLGQMLAQAALPLAGAVQLVVPMPLHPRKLRARGYNQSALLASHVARGLGVPLAIGLLVRVRDTPAQARLDRAQRVANVRGAFDVRGAALVRVPSRLSRVLLVDDVRTTGATLAAASEALSSSGRFEVASLALAAATE